MKLKKTTKLIILQYILPSLVVSIIGVITVLINIIYTNKLTKETYYENIYFQQKIKTFDERLKLVDELSKLIGMKTGVNDIWYNYLNSIKVINKKIYINDVYSEKLLKYNADYLSVLTKIGLYFGPESKKVLLEFNNEKGPWWEKKPETYNKLLEAMVKELKYGLEN